MDFPTPKCIRLVNIVILQGLALTCVSMCKVGDAHAPCEFGHRTDLRLAWRLEQQAEKSACLRLHDLPWRASVDEALAAEACSFVLGGKIGNPSLSTLVTIAIPCTVRQPEAECRPAVARCMHIERTRRGAGGRVYGGV